MGIPTSAKGPATGYLYQAYYSLLALLEADPGTSVVLEKIEDVDLYDGKATHLLQLKHKLKPGGMLIDSSLDFVKTLSNWSDRLVSGAFDAETTILKLLTTQKIKPDSIPGLLASDARDPEAAYARLKDFLEQRPGKTIARYVENLRRLNDDQLWTLVSLAEVVGEQPHIDAIEKRLSKQIGIMVPPQHVSDVVHAVLGIWVEEVRRQLTSNDPRPIEQQWLHEAARYHAAFYREESLPIYPEINADDSVFQSLEGRRFVSQLKKIGINIARLETYKEDYFLASKHVSKWSRDNLVSEDLMARYYRKLEREWREVLFTLVDELEYDTEEERAKFGKALLKNLMFDRLPNIKKHVDEPFVARGCYHMLADEPGRLFWHPSFEEGLLEQVLQEYKRGAA
jgi:hypothetical protein